MTGDGRTFTYDGQGQLDTCTGTSCAPVFDNDGRLIQITTASGTWRYEYDDDGRLVKACNTTTCPGSGVARLEFAYDSEGRRTTVSEIPASGTRTDTTFSYEGDHVVRVFVFAARSEVRGWWSVPWSDLDTFCVRGPVAVPLEGLVVQIVEGLEGPAIVSDRIPDCGPGWMYPQG